MDDPHGVVRRGYDEIAARYAEASLAERTDDTYYRSFVDRCLELVPAGGRILDVGCGAGIVAADLARRGVVVGVDLSFEQLRLARERVPSVALVQADMTRFEVREGSLDAVAAFWTVIHVRRELHAALFQRMHAWLRPGGVLFGVFGRGDNPDDHVADFHGAPMYWSHFDAETNRGLLRAAGFRLELADEVEDMGEQPLWVIARA